MTYSRFLLAGALAAFLLPARAAAPAPEQLLPDDTLAMISLPDFARVQRASRDSAMWRLWRDPAMAPFRDKFLHEFQEDVVDPFESKTGLNLAEYAGLLRGQITLGVTRNGWTGTENPLPGLVLLIDTGDQAEQLRTKLAEVKAKLADSGQTVRTREVRGFEFAEVRLTDEGDEAQLSAFFGPAEGLLVVSLNGGTRDIERVLARMAGSSSVRPLADDPAFQKDRGLVFRDALSFGWINAAPLVEIGLKLAADAAGEQSGFGPRPDAILNALGLSSLKSLAFGARAGEEGEEIHFFIGSPEGERRGLFRFPVGTGMDAAPPAFIPQDASGYSRARISGPKLWQTIVEVANGVAPGMIDFGIAQLESGIKERNPDFDLRRDLIGNLGDDLISYEKLPRENTIEGLSNQPTITLVGSPAPERLMDAIKTLVSTAFGMPFDQREFLGRQIHSLPLPFAPPGPDGAIKINLCAGAGYLAISMDGGILEEYLRSADSLPRPLSATPGLPAAAEKVGGMRTGLFGLQNDRAMMGALVEALRADGNEVLDMLGEELPGGMGMDGSEMEAKLKEWFDFKLLPPYAQIEKYFHFTVFAGQASAAGFSLRFNTPMPPGLR